MRWKQDRATEAGALVSPGGPASSCRAATTAFGYGTVLMSLCARARAFVCVPRGDGACGKTSLLNVFTRG